ncbi:SDR family oxidoreductase [Nocardioides sp. AE5]|uniref:SDR family oxidoreductase n=1 Tax=Nocardioides sp. AE5 TaxID=2962573 RepID=UPI002881C43C|nr:SDR family oxidoreductase [Nocardioides sp. AE5]MDT0200971.1 SDR family oxidoreductase [Nocardioides sp. AE5]
MALTHLVTGAGSGIGASVARALAARGDALWLLARNDERAADLRADFPTARVVTADLADPEALAGQLGQLPQRLDTLLHVAGAVDLGTVAEQPIAQVRRQVDVNLLAPMELTRLCLPALRAARGLVLVVNSTSGITANPDWSAYAASKFGARAFTDALRAEEAAHGVRVTSVHPSRTATPMQAEVHRQEGRDYDPDRFIAPDTVAATILHVIDLPRDGTITEVTVRPGPR